MKARIGRHVDKRDYIYKIIFKISINIYILINA